MPNSISSAIRCFPILVRLVFALALTTHVVPAQATPSYVGPYTYTSYIRNEPVVFGDEMSAINAYISYAAAANGESFGSLAELSVWNVWNWNTEGYETLSIRDYSWIGSNCNTGAPCHFGHVQRQRRVCSSTERYFASIDVCMGGYPEWFPDANGKNAGNACPTCGQPINPMTGNMYHTFTDYKSARSLAVERTYNSYPLHWGAASLRQFGMRWTHRYDTVVRYELVAADPTYSFMCWRYNNGILECPNVYFPDTRPPAVSINRADGKRYMFNFDSRSGSWYSDANVDGKLSSVLNAEGTRFTEFTFVDAVGDVTEKFAGDGILLSITERNGQRLQLTYSDGATNDTAVGRFPDTAPICQIPDTGDLLPEHRLMCVTDQWGAQLHFQYDAKGRVAKVIDPSQQSYLYEYDGPSGGCVPGNEATAGCKANNLTKVNYPDGRSQTYFYNEAGQINGGATCSAISFPAIGNGFGQFPNVMTGMVDESGVRSLTWAYDCKSRATLSQEANGVNQVKLSYTEIDAGNLTRSATVTHTVGPANAPTTTSRTYGTSFIMGVGKNTSISGPCAECGTIKSRTYDANGNIATANDFNNNVTKYTYDLLRNLETSRTEAFGSPQARTISTAWHPAYRLPLRIAEANRLTTFEHDASGNVLKRTVRATTDANGAQGFAATPTSSPRVWSYTYNADGQLATVTSPRTDVVSKTSYLYDTQGNLASVTNAAGHTTTLSNYDADGRVGRITDPNGLATDLGYNARGLLTSSSSGGETTAYDYNPVGGLTQVTLPGGATITYTRDDANRLTGIADNLGNSIGYTLDLTGNRLSEQVRDPQGTLVRQTTRVFDQLNRVQQITGAQQ